MINTVQKTYVEGEWTNSYSVTFTDGTVWEIPHDTANRHYQEILEWVAEGNTITDNGGSE
jgi:hypothetical protein